MLWLNPSALFALLAIAAPILIHILIQRRAERLAFPTLRFLQPTRLASIRRHVLEDLPLLAVRAAVLAAAAAALAGPLLVTAGRRQAWDRRIVRAVVVDDTAGAPASQAALQQTFAGSALPDSIRRAVVWLDTAPPARREIVIASAFPIESITQADIAAIPPGIGVRFERSSSLPPTRTVPAGRLLTSAAILAREVTLNGDQTSFHEVDTGVPSVWPVEVSSIEDDQPAIDAAIAAALSQRVWAAPPDRRVHVVLVQAADNAARATSEGPNGGAVSGAAQAFRHAVTDAVSTVSPIQQPWMATAVGRIAAEEDLRTASVRVAAGLADPRFATAPWHMLAAAADGRPLAAAAGSSDRLLVASAAPAKDVATPVLLRAIGNAIADAPDLRRAEVLPISAEVLQHWSRPPAPVISPRIETVDQDDRRWLWIAVLGLLAIEAWIRRAQPTDTTQAQREERARVA